MNVNVQDNMDRTPLQLAVEHYVTDVIDVLLDHGADPNSANRWGLTSLHSICFKYCSDNWTKIFFKLNDNMLQVDVQDKKGYTPLHYALSHGNKNMTELLLKRGANPNLTNNDASTPLHVAFDAEQDCRDDSMSLFFEITDNLNLAVQVNALDSLGLTPLQYAVASLSPKIVDILLDHGADLAGFVFPDEASFTKYIDWYKREQFQHKLELASGLLVVVEHLEKKGWELNQSNVLIIMGLFTKLVFEKSTE
uniref:Uncharacterized protein n=1 Tax=Trichogramma kaykai TaxID=54128 RepID=A0ABD2XJM1_9HYME